MKRQEAREKCVMKSSVICRLHEVLLGRSNQEAEYARESHMGGGGGDENCTQNVGLNYEGKRQLGRPFREGKDYVLMVQKDMCVG
jgi:hypothetical protein